MRQETPLRRYYTERLRQKRLCKVVRPAGSRQKQRAPTRRYRWHIDRYLLAWGHFLQAGLWPDTLGCEVFVWRQSTDDDFFADRTERTSRLHNRPVPTLAL